MSKIFSYQCVT